MLCVFVTPILSGLYWKRATKAGAVASIISGLVISLSFGYIDKYIWSMPFHFSFVPFLTGVVVMVVISLLTKSTTDKVLKETDTGLWF